MDQLPGQKETFTYLHSLRHLCCTITEALGSVPRIVLVRLQEALSFKCDSNGKVTKSLVTMQKFAKRTATLHHIYCIYTLNNQCGTQNYTLGVTKQTRLRIWGNDTGDFERSETEERDAIPFTGHSLHKGKGTIRRDSCCIGLYWCVLAIWSFTKMCCGEIKANHTHTCIYIIFVNPLSTNPSHLTWPDPYWQKMHFLAFSAQVVIVRTQTSPYN